MKSINRTISVHKYTFANIDLSSGKAVNMHTVESAIQLTQSEIKKYCEEHENCLCIFHDTEDRKYTLPLEQFIAACEQYHGTIVPTEETND